MDEKKSSIPKLEHKASIHKLILDSLNEGIVVINNESEIIHLNRSAEKMIGINKQKVLGKKISDWMPIFELQNVLKTRTAEINNVLFLESGLKIITSRIPIIDDSGHLFGALLFFKDFNQVVNFAEELTNLKELRTILNLIVQSSDEAISVVDENGIGKLMNQAYLSITGLTESQVIAKPMCIDRSEVEKIQLKVLDTRRDVSGVPMNVGLKKVIANVSPVIVEGKLKGSICVMKDLSETNSLRRELKSARQIIRNLEAKHTFEDIIGASEEMSLAIAQAKLGAKNFANILLRGESGSGKKLFAHAIHNASSRKYNKFIRVDCTGIPESLLELELFGCEEGDTLHGKRDKQKSVFEVANNGSVLLDEVGELSTNIQVKLLKVLQENQVTRAGGIKGIPINVRVIAATSQNIEMDIVNGTFREDLFYQLNKIPIHIAPLRNRKSDIILLCDHLIKRINQEFGRNVKGISTQALTCLMRYNWPGNVRELHTILARAVILMNKNEMYVDSPHLPEINNTSKEIVPSKDQAIENNQTLVQMVEQFEKNKIAEILEKNEGNKTLTAKELGLSVRNLYYKLDKYGIFNDNL